MANASLDGMLPTDTRPEVERILIEGYRRMSAAQKLGQVQSLSMTVRQLALADIRRRHPEAGEREQLLRLASRSMDAALLLKAFGWDPDVEGY